MTFFRREADRLNTYLDDQLAGQSIDPDDLDSSLVDTWTWAKTAMAQMPSDPDAKSDTWRALMQAHAVAAPLPAASLNPPVRRLDDLAKPHWSHRAMAMVGAAALVIGLVAGIAGFDRFGGGGAPNEPTSIPAASFFLPGTPEATGCDVRRREPGAIEQIVQTPPSQMPYFPRLNPDPVSQPILESGLGDNSVDGTALWMNSSPDDSAQAGIQQMLDTLYDCRAFAIGSDGRTDMEGPFFSLFSDDYFRRELNGYVAAGQEVQLGAFWMPATRPVAVETRKLMDGERYLVVLDETIGLGGDSRVLSVVPGEDGSWYIDEVGRMTDPQIDAEGTPIASLDFSDVTPVPAVERFPHELTMAIADLTVANQFGLVCDFQDGTPVPCTDAGLWRIGPWAPNELPASIPFTVTFVNTSDVATHIVSPALSIDVELPAGERVELEVNAEPGSYEILFAQGDSTSTWTFQFEPEDGRFSMG
ncbi:MAG: hypothetical protein KF883_02900 [Thermomicrobiales bacterium]|nr:hypothetical protein [Thermomicrobiales bacterium]